MLEGYMFSSVIITMLYVFAGYILYLQVEYLLIILFRFTF